MINSFKTLGCAAILAILCLPPMVATAQQCTAEQLAAAVDQAGAALRAITAANQPKLEQRIQALRAKHGWTEADGEEKVLDALSDPRMAELDRTANDLLARIDQLGHLPARAVPECGRLQDIEAASLELQAAIKAKSTAMLARADALLAVAPAAVATAPEARASAPPSVARSAPEPVRAPPVVAPAAPAPKPAPAPSAWATTTTAEPRPAVPPAGATQPPREDDAYTIDEIVRASSGVFGKVSAGLGGLIEHTFSEVGRPTGYIVGQEGGGAFLAGLRYGSGTLYLRDGRTTTIYWHGPSLGLDIGAQGAKVMFLVYRLRDPEQLVPTFTSIEGSAFVAGGIGMTLMTNGDAQLAPIRSGIGLRIGASIGYVRFTRRATWNPF